MKKRPNPSSWRAHIDKELRQHYALGVRVESALSDDEWVALSNDGTVEHLDAGRRTVVAAAETVMIWRRAHQTSERTLDPGQWGDERRRSSQHQRWHEDAVSDVMARHAEHEIEHGFGVRQFRDDVLGGRLLSVEEVAKWVKDHARHDVPIATVPSVVNGHETRKVVTLAYGTPESDWMRRVVVPVSGVLYRLQAIAKRLEAFYGWDEAQATNFVLTGGTPLIHSIRATVATCSPLLVRSRIKLSIDPATTPREVADHYRRIRREAFGRVRRLSERHARLAAFAATLSDGLAPAVQMRRWNHQCMVWKKPKWRFRHPSRLLTEARQSVDRLVELGKV